MDELPTSIRSLLEEAMAAERTAEGAKLRVASALTSKGILVAGNSVVASALAALTAGFVIGSLLSVTVPAWRAQREAMTPAVVVEAPAHDISECRAESPRALPPPSPSPSLPVDRAAEVVPRPLRKRTTPPAGQLRERREQVSRVPQAAAPALPECLPDAEFGLLRDATQALAAGRAATAREALNRQARLCPNSLWTEEREALRAVVACTEHRDVTTADAFVRRFPGSALIARVRAACSGAP